MSAKYSYQNYTITVDFKTDFTLSMTASDIYSGDFFINQNIELTKIKKDTVIATLTRKNEQHLKCKFNVVDIQPKKLIISFEVSFDFLPTFTEYVSLDQIQNKGKGLNKVQSAELKSDIEELQKLLNNITSKQSFVLRETTNTFSPKGTIFEGDLEQGSYLLEISGYFTCTTTQKHDLIISVKIGQQHIDLPLCLYTNSSYGYPYSTKKDIILRRPQQISVTAQHKQGQSFTLTSNIVTFAPMIKVN